MTPFVAVLLALTEPPTPPPSLLPWIEYAKQLAPEQPDCPPAGCVHLQRLEVSGRPSDGRIELRLSGVNLGRLEQRAAFVRPAATFSVTRARFAEGRGRVALGDDAWVVVVPPGRFTLEAELGFEPAASLPIDFGGPFAAVVDRLSAGRLVADESGDGHAGAMVLTSTGSRMASAGAVSVRVVRQLSYGSVVTFAYDYTVTGLREQTRLELPRLGDESFEAVEPDTPFTVTPESLVVTLAPGHNRLRASGHFAARPTRFKKPKALPFEHWLVDVDARHPADLTTSGLEVNPGDVPKADVSPRSRGFLLMEQQTLDITPLAVTVDRGQRGSGRVRLSYLQGEPDAWVGTLDLTSTTRPEEDRVEIPTPAPPHYAEVGRAAVRMYSDGGTLSVRALAADGSLQPVRVQWRERLETNPVLSALRLGLPAQALHLDHQKVDVGLLPGFVPMLVLGAESSSGDLLDGLHIYAALLAVLAVALARAARLPRSAVAVAGVLFFGLYTVDDFPRLELLLLLAGCAVLTLLPTRLLTALRQSRRSYALVSLVWLALLLAAMAPSVTYARARLLAALHPWSAASELSADRFAQLAPGSNNAPPAEAEELLEPEAPVQQKLEEQRAPDKKESGYDAASGGSSYLGARKLARGARAQIIRPVAFEASSLPLVHLQFELGQTLPGESQETTVLIAGPILRGAWLFAEVAGLLALWGFVIVRARRLWAREEVA